MSAHREYLFMLMLFEIREKKGKGGEIVGPMDELKLRRKTDGKWFLMLCWHFDCTCTEMK